MGAKAEHNLTWFGGLGRESIWARQRLSRRSPRRGSGGGGRSPPDAGKRVKNFVEK